MLVDLFPLSIHQSFLGGLFTFLAPCLFAVLFAYSIILAMHTEYYRDKIKLSSKKTIIFGLLSTFIFIVPFIIIFSALQTLPPSFTFFVFKLRSSLFILGAICYFALAFFIFPSSKKSTQQILSRWQVISLFYFITAILGVVLGLSWTACIGPTLGAILFHLSNNESMLYGVFHLIIFCLGLGGPFFLLSLFISFLMNSFISFTSLHKQKRQYFFVFLGLIVGGLLWSNKLAFISASLLHYGSLELYFMG